MLRAPTFPPSQHTCGVRGTSPCLHLLILENPCSTGTSLDVGFFFGFHFPASHPGLRCSSHGSELEVPGGVARACPAGISTFGKFVCKGILTGVFPRTLPHPLGPNSFPGMSPVLGGGRVASPAAPASHLSLHKSRKYSRAPVLAPSGIPNGTGIFGNGLCLPVWNVEPCKPLSFGSASLEKPFLPVTCVPSRAGAAQSRIPLDSFPAGS